MTFQPGQSGNPAGRPRGSVNKNLAMLRDAVEKVLPLVVERALNGDAEAQRLILEKGLPKLKAIDPPIEFVLPNEEYSSTAHNIFAQVSKGELPLSYARQILCYMMPLLIQEKENMERIGSQDTIFNNTYICNILRKMNYRS